MFGMTSSDTCFTILLTVYGVYCAWAKYCECRWPENRYEKNESGGDVGSAGGGS